MSETHRIAILIPCYNAAPTIKTVLLGLELPDILSRIEEVLVIDNGSVDGSREILIRSQVEARLGGRLKLIENEKNLGYGGSVKKGLRLFLDAGFTHIILLHADDQCNSRKTVKGFLDELDRDPTLDAILSSRFSHGAKTEGYSWPRIAGNHFFNLATGLLTGYFVPDAGSAVCLYRADMLRRIPFEKLTTALHFHPQLNICLYDEGFRTKTVPIDWRDSEAKSNVKVVPYSLKLLEMLTRYFFSARLKRVRAVDYFSKLF